MRLLIVNDFGVACPVINRECHEIEYWEDVHFYDTFVTSEPPK